VTPIDQLSTEQLMNVSFSRRTELGLAALRALATADERVSRASLAGQVGTTASFLPQVMAPLVQAGWVVSERGPGGGYRLTDKAYKARLLDVLEAVEGPTANGQCVFRDAPCPGDESCPIHAVWVEARQVLVDGFDGILVLETDSKGGQR
jgi:Rrf2 family protein